MLYCKTVNVVDHMASCACCPSKKVLYIPTDVQNIIYIYLHHLIFHDVLDELVQIFTPPRLTREEIIAIIYEEIDY